MDFLLTLLLAVLYFNAVMAVPCLNAIDQLQLMVTSSTLHPPTSYSYAHSDSLKTWHLLLTDLQHKRLSETAHRTKKSSPLGLTVFALKGAAATFMTKLHFTLQGIGISS